MRKIISVPRNLDSDQKAFMKRVIGGTLVGGGLGALIQTVVYPLTDVIITAVQTQGMTTQEALRKYVPEIWRNYPKLYAGFSYILMATFPKRVAIFLPREIGDSIARQQGVDARYGMYGGIAVGAVLETLCWNPAEFLKTQAQGVQVFEKPPFVESKDFWTKWKTRYTGFTPNLSKNMVNNLMVYGVAKECSGYFPFENALTNLFASTTLFTFGVQSVTTPLDTIRSKAQACLVSPQQALNLIIQESGWKKLYAAVCIRGLRQAAVGSTLNVLYEKAKEHFNF